MNISPAPSAIPPRRSRATVVSVMAATLALVLVASSSASAANELPDASFGVFPRDPVSGQTVRLVSYACDPDGSLAEQVWDLDNDGSFDDGLGPEVRTAFSAGSHIVRLRATDQEAAASFGSRLVDVTPGTPEYVLPRPFRPPLLSPFPVVQLSGRLTRTGARIRLLTVRAPVCSRVTVRCRGRTCPLRRATRLIGRKRIRFRAIERRRLRAGVRLEVLVSKRDRIGKYTRFRIRRDRPPSRLDACLRFGDQQGSACPRD